MNYLISKEWSGEFPFYFYKTTNLINGKFYYGSGHKENYLGSGKVLKNAIKKNGKENFKIEKLRFFKNRQDAYNYEERFLKLYKVSSLNESYNLKDDSLGGNTWECLSGDQKQERFKHHGKTLEEAYGVEKAQEIKSKISKGTKPTKGKTLEEVYGVEKAQEMKSKMKGWNPDSDTRKRMGESAKIRGERKRKQKIEQITLFLNTINIDEIIIDSEIYNKIIKIRRYKQIENFKTLYPNIENRIKEIEYEKRSISQKGRKHSEETKKHLSEIKKGTKGTPNKNKGLSFEEVYGKEKSNIIRTKISNAQRGKKHSEESKQKMSNAQRGKKHSEECKNKISKTLLNTIVIIDGVEYFGYQSAVDATGFSREKIKYRVYSKGFPNYQVKKLSTKYR